EPILCFDGDKAGQNAALRAAERVLPLLKPGLSLRFAMMPAGKDPDDICRTEGAAAMQQVLVRSVPLSKVLWENLLSTHSIDTPERRAALVQDSRELANRVEDVGVREFYRQEFRKRLNDLLDPSIGSAPTPYQRKWKRDDRQKKRAVFDPSQRKIDSI